MTPRLIASVALGLAATNALAACEVRGGNFESVPETPITPYDAAAIPDDAADLEDAGSASDALVETAASIPVSPVQGNPLCNASQSTSKCFPDMVTSARACNLAPDGGAFDPAAGYAGQLACHVEPATDGSTAQPACTPAGQGTSGVPCSAPTDCAAGFECIGSSGTCQAYCCIGEARCNLHEFCDIQAVSVPAQTTVPVCMPISDGGCTLLAPAACPPTETCAVVRENGATSCVARGAAMAGDSCDREHCGLDLVCLGTPGQRRCYKLCLTAKPDCSALQTCKGGLTLFPDPKVGVGICE
jgi:hypothetical protein